MIDEEAQNDQEISHFAFRITDFGFGMCDVGCVMSNTVYHLPFTTSTISTVLTL